MLEVHTPDDLGIAPAQCRGSIPISSMTLRAASAARLTGLDRVYTVGISRE